MNICLHCAEPILPFELIPQFEGKMHRECAVRSVIGSVAHQQRKSLACDGECCDDPNLTKRQNALLAARYFLSV